jgi:hypothetical protein
LKAVAGEGVHRERVVYTTPCTKFNRRGGKPQPSVLVATSLALYVLEAEKFKLKRRIPYGELQELTISAGRWHQIQTNFAPVLHSLRVHIVLV